MSPPCCCIKQKTSALGAREACQPSSRWWRKVLASHGREEASGHSGPSGQCQEGEKNGAGFPRGSGTGQEGRYCLQGPSLSQCMKQHLPPHCRASCRLHRTAGGQGPSAAMLGRAADRNWEDGDALSRSPEYCSPLRQNLGTPPSFPLRPSLPDAPPPQASPLHCVGTFPKAHCFPLISFLSRHLELPPAGPCHPSW